MNTRVTGVIAAMIGFLWVSIQSAVVSATQSAAGSPPGSRVVLGDFSIDATEVTVAQLRQTLKRHNRQTKAETEGGGYEYAAGWEQRPGWVWHAPFGEPAAPAEPAVHITWYEARYHCAALGGRLPDFDEWQLAAYTEMRDQATDGYRKGQQYVYPVGDDPQGMNTAGQDPWARHAPAGVTRRGVNGLYDMGANVWEWLADVEGERALTAGGSWWYGSAMTRAQGAQYKPRDFAAVYIGFRCVYAVD